MCCISFVASVVQFEYTFVIILVVIVRYRFYCNCRKNGEKVEKSSNGKLRDALKRAKKLHGISLVVTVQRLVHHFFMKWLNNVELFQL
jgi:hypothetical protein